MSNSANPGKTAATESSSSDPSAWLNKLFQAGWGSAGGPQAAAGDADLAAALSTAMRQVAELQKEYLDQVTRLWGGMWGWTGPAEGEGQAREDRRFSAEAWSRDPRFDALRRTYIACSDALQRAVELAPLDEKSKLQLSFTARQFSEAMSPSNFFATNPEAIELAIQTGGRSVVEGTALFLEDLGKGRVTMSDESAFAVGRNLAVTEGAVVFENDLMQLIQYTPRTADVHARPLLLVPPCINKFYILDLQPENSLVRYAVEQGHTVFLVSWRNIKPELGHLTWDDYLQLGVFRAIDIAKEIARSDRINVLGFCVGGTLLASALALMAQSGEDKVSSLTLLTTLLDFSDGGEIGHLITEDSVAQRERAIGGGGILPGRELATVFSSLRANDLIWQYVSNGYLKGKAPPAFDMLYWNSDATNLPGPMFCWYVRNTYLENKLRIPGKTMLCGAPVDLSSITVPAYLYASREDHIVPWRGAFASRRLLGGETTFTLGASGHIAGVINAPAKKKRNYWTGGAGTDAEKWLESAASVPGSWWPHWSEWLARHAGPRVARPASLGSRKYRPTEPAPGRYVMEKDA